MSSETNYGKQRFAAVVPLVLILVSALIWSGFATFEYATVTYRVPGDVAWALVAALDGTVLVTTPIWLSTLLPASVRNYAALICGAALVGSCVINYSETGWPGVFPPLIAGALIHLVGVVLRAFAVLEEGVDFVEEVTESAPVPPVSLDKKVAAVPAPVKPKRDAPAPVLHLAPRPPEGRPADVAAALLETASAAGHELPGGAEITKACRTAGHEVNDNYGRSFKSRWLSQRDGSSEAVSS